MRKTRALSLLLGVAMLGACAKKPPAQLPPSPDAEASESGVSNEAVGAAVPGSQAHFLVNVMSDRIFFDTDQFNVDAEDQTVLRSQAQWLASYPAARVTIEGHADERGTREYNLALGERRANSAKNYLVSLGVDEGRITTISFGKERPEALGSDEGSWSRNRRAVTVVVE
jgi:peptidoglycan-associated lipoprotein